MLIMLATSSLCYCWLIILSFTYQMVSVRISYLAKINERYYKNAVNPLPFLSQLSFCSALGPSTSVGFGPSIGSYGSPAMFLLCSLECKAQAGRDSWQSFLV